MAKEPKEGQLIIDGNRLDLDIKITMTEITDMLVTRDNEALLQERDKFTTQVDAARREHARLETTLQNQASELANKRTNKEALLAAKALKAFDGNERYVHIKEGQVDVDKKKVHGQIVVSSSKEYSAYGSSIASISFSENFTKDMRDTVKQLATKSEEIHALDRALDQIRAKRKDLTRKAELAKSDIVEAYLTGNLRTGDDVMTQIESRRLKSLPAPTKD